MVIKEKDIILLIKDEISKNNLLIPDIDPSKKLDLISKSDQDFLNSRVQDYFDSIDIMETLMAIEDEYNVNMPDKKYETFQDIIQTAIHFIGKRHRKRINTAKEDEL